MLSRVTLLGNLGRSPEMKSSKDGKFFTNFSVATKHGYGERAKTSWWNVTAFGKTAEAVNTYTDKGSQVYVEGDIVDEEYTNQAGTVVKTKKVLATTVKFIGPKVEKAAATETEESDPTDEFWK